MREWQNQKAQAEAVEPKVEGNLALEVDSLAIRREDLIHAQLKATQRKFDRALVVVSEALAKGAVGVSFSGGKDSTVVLDLVRRIDPNSAAAFFDSGAELQGTIQIVADYGVEIIHPRMTLLDMARYVGWWGYHDPVDPDCGFDAKTVLIQEPSEAFVVRRRLSVVAYGLRMQESGGRKVHLATRGELWRGRDRTWYCAPLAKWSLSDVWAYIASRRLRYHPAYDALSAAGIPREAQRIGAAIGSAGAGMGRHWHLRIAEPETWRRLVVEFPALAAQS
jgi:phosphoadenosine phosphosulfate reductase